MILSKFNISRSLELTSPTGGCLSQTRSHRLLYISIIFILLTWGSCVHVRMTVLHVRMYLLTNKPMCPGLNSKPRHTILFIAIRLSDGDVKPGGPPWCFSRRAGYESAPGFTFSLHFIIISHNTITLHKQLHIQSP